MTSDAGTACSVNKYCLSAAQYEYPCPDGYQNNLSGQEACTECGSGSFCYQTFSPDPATTFSATTYTQNVVACAGNNTECTGELNQRNIKCQKGTYLNGATCDICTNGNYCRGGVIAGPCIAGYFCENSLTAISVPNPSNFLCDLNNYCPEGTAIPGDVVACGANFFSSEKGGKTSEDCFDCEPGYLCSTTAVEPCPVGNYCPDGVTTTPCPIWHYSNIEKLFMVEMCQVCPAGYKCDATGISDYEAYPCAAGHYCVPNSDNTVHDPTNSIDPEKMCPPGYYLASPGADNVNDCKICPKGYYCDQTSLTAPIRCSDGNEC